jgi:hypothetical protein
MFGRQQCALLQCMQWTLFADQVRLSELFRGKIFVLILGLIFDTPLFTFFCTILTPSKILASVSPFRTVATNTFLKSDAVLYGVKNTTTTLYLSY